MGTHSKPGFTIIETMLVLAITGVLIAGLLVGIGSSISNQRYGDAVSSFKALLQDQYSRVSNVSNDRDADWTCAANATPVQAGGGIAPGQSDCVLLGRYVGVVNGDISMATIVGYENSTAAGTNDITELKDNYTLGVSTSSVETTTLEWGAQIAWPKSGGGFRNPTTPRSLAIFILRSPNSGTTYTFTSDTVVDVADISSATLKAMMVQTTASYPGQGARTICVDPGGVGVPEILAVNISSGASAPGAIETRSNATAAALVADGTEAPKC